MVKKVCKSVSLLDDGSYSLVREDGTSVQVCDKVFIWTTLLANPFKNMPAANQKKLTRVPKAAQLIPPIKEDNNHENDHSDEDSSSSDESIDSEKTNLLREAALERNKMQSEESNQRVGVSQRKFQ